MKDCWMKNGWKWEGSRPLFRRQSPWWYLANIAMRTFWCSPESREAINGRTYILPAVCTYPGRHSCGLQLAGHDPGDEDPNP
jgi:hypothetical protein